MATDSEEFGRILKDTLERLGTDLDTSSKEISRWSREVTKGKRDILKMAPALEKLKESVDNSQSALSKAAKGSEAYEKLQRKVNDSTAQYNKALKDFVSANVMNGLATSIVKAGSAFVRGSRDMAFTAIQGMQSGMDSIELGSEIFRKEIQRNTEMATAAFESIAQAGAAIPLKMGLAAELAGKAGVELTNQISVLTTKGIDVLSAELTKTKANFMELSKTGAFFAGGMTEMRNSAAAAGLRLQDYGQVVKNAGDNLRTFGVNQTQAMAMVGKVTTAMGNGVNLQLRNLGYTQAEIAEGTAEYMANLARSGTLAGKSQGDLAKESAGYLSNMKLISAITGEDAKAAQKRAQEASMELGIQTKLNSMGPEAQEKFNNLIKQFPSLTKEIKQLFLNGITDNALLLNSPAMAALQGGINDISDTSVKAKDSIIRTQDALNATRDQQMAYNAQFQSVTRASVMGMNVGDLATQANALSGIYVQSARSGQDLSKQLDGQSKTTDKTTITVNLLQQEMEKAAIALEKELTPSLYGFATQLRTTFMDVEKYVKAALVLMVSQKGVSTPGIGNNNPDIENAKLDVEKIARETNATFWQKMGLDKSNTRLRDAQDRLRRLEESVMLEAQQADPTANFAVGGLVNAKPGGTVARLAEAGMNEAVVPLPNGRSIPVDSPALTELATAMRTGMNLAPLVERLAESNQLLRSQLEATKRTNEALDYNNDLNKQILSVTR